jgi:feruloyl esterase
MRSKKILKGVGVVIAGLAILFGVGSLIAAREAPTDCGRLANFALEGGKIDSSLPATRNDSLNLDLDGVPSLWMPAAFCRVRATLTPTPKSRIQIEVWLPARDKWNGKLLAAGNGGFAGNFDIPHLFMRNAVKRGYATTGTDSGHQGTDAKWASGQKEKIDDYGWRATHLTALAAKAIIKAYYHSEVRKAYFQGCSNGGREALMEAQRFPGDFNGIIAGAPANSFTGFASTGAWTQRALARPGASLTDDHLSLIRKAVLAQCDGIDGVKDGVLEDPRQCRFDPARLQCKPGYAKDCLSSPQVAALKDIHRGPHDPVTGASVLPGFPVGGEGVETAWDQWITGPEPELAFFANEFFANMVFTQRDWTFRQFDLIADSARARAALGPTLDSLNPDLSAFKDRGGKLILYHGWADAGITPLNSIAYIDNVRARMGVRQTDDVARLFMVPGMSHCIGGPGTDNFDMLTALEQWEDKGMAPDRIVAEKRVLGFLAPAGWWTGPLIRSRPLCPYPKIARWNGIGSTAKAENFACVNPSRTEFR